MNFKKFLFFSKYLFLFLLIILSLNACSPAQKEEKNSNNKDNNISQTEGDFDNVFKVKVKEGEYWIYYLGADGKRYIFPTDGTYKSWFKDKEVKKEKTLDEIAKIPIGGNVTYKPGSKLLKTDSVDDLFFVAPGGILRPISADIAKEYYGENWQDYIDVIENYYFTNYKIGKPINSVKDIPVIPENWTINDDKNLF